MVVGDANSHRSGSSASGMLGRYRLLHEVGSGGMGVVHLALDPSGHAVAIKVLRPHIAADPEARTRLAREVSTLRRVRSPRVAEVLDADVEGERPYLVAQYVPGSPLDAAVRDTGPLTGERLVDLGRGLAEALEAIHAAGIVHRDLKPGNVLILDGQPIVIDFGIAQVADDVRLTSTGLVMGTPGYLSPEVVAGDDVSAATDWWGWAATMAFAATGRPPFGRGPVEVVLDRVRRADADLDGVDDALRPVLQEALAVHPQDRPGPSALLGALEAYAAGTGPGPARQRERGASEAETATLTVVRGDDDTRALPLPAAAEPRTAALQLPMTAALPRVARPDQPTAQSPPQFPSPQFSQAPSQYPYPGPGQPPQPMLPSGRPTGSTGSSSAAYPGRASRGAVLTAALVALCAVTAVAPLVGAATGAVGMVLARTVDRTLGALSRRRYERGARRSDPALAVVESPWHLVMATLVSVPALLLPALVGVATVVLVGVMLGTMASLALGEPLALAAGAGAAALTAWWGPGGASVRRGSRSLARAVAPTDTASVVVTAVLAIVILAAVLVVFQQGGQPDWTPLPGPPFSGVPAELPALP